MTNPSIRNRVKWVFGLAALVVTSMLVTADDTKTTAKEPITKAPDFSKYTFVKDVTGEVVKADDKKVTVRVKWTQAKGAVNNPRVKPMVEEKHQDYDFQFLPESVVRMRRLPTKTDEKGKKVEYTQKEKEALKLPNGYVGYAATYDDLKVGSTVYVYLIREKSIPSSKATDDDLRVKYVVIEPSTDTTTKK